MKQKPINLVCAAGVPLKLEQEIIVGGRKLWAINYDGDGLYPNRFEDGYAGYLVSALENMSIAMERPYTEYRIPKGAWEIAFEVEE